MVNFETSKKVQTFPRTTLLILIIKCMIDPHLFPMSNKPKSAQERQADGQATKDSINTVATVDRPYSNSDSTKKRKDIFFP
jgi:hypothetical protein